MVPDVGYCTLVADCSVAANLADAPKFKTFFELQPWGRNYKTMTVRAGEQTFTVKFTWFAGQPCYVHAWNHEDRRECYLGIYNYDRNVIEDAPTGLTAGAVLRLVAKKILYLFERNKLNYLFNHDG